MNFLSSIQNNSNHVEFHQTVINSLVHQLAIIDLDGNVIATNNKWDEYCIFNDGNLNKCSVGSNYLAVSGPEIKEGIQLVLNGIEEKFMLEYPCHTSEEKRWILMVVTPLINDKTAGKIEGAVITHFNITDRKLLEIQEKKDLELAKSIQQSVLMPPIKADDIAIEGLFLPSNHLSGDMYAWYKVDDDHYGVILLDIMGHGLSSSLISMSIRSLLQGIITRARNPVDVYQELNKHFYQLFRTVRIPKLYFCTGIYLLINTKEKTIQYFNAGQPTGVIKGEHKNQLLSKTIVPIGLKENPEVSFQTITYDDNDHIVLYTDGLSDSLKKSPREFEEFVVNAEDALLKGLNSKDYIKNLIGDSFQIDDISVISIQL